MKFRYWLIRLLFTASEKHLVARAIDDRSETLWKLRVNERWVVKEDIDNDIKDYKELKKIFTTDDWI